MKCIQIEKKPPKKFRPPPKPSAARAPPAGEKVYISGGVPPPPLPPGGRPRPPPHPGAPPCPLPPPGAPPPPPRKPGAPQPPRPPPPPGAPSPSLQPPGSLPRGGGGGVKVQRVPELVEFYNSLMKRDSKKDTRSVGGSLTESDAKSNLLGEMQSKLWFLQAVKADVETQGEFVKAMAVEVRAAAFSNIEDVVAFVNWLDEELSFLVDECAVLKHFDWPETGASTLREAASQYQELMRLNLEVTSFVDDPKLPCESALSKMHKLREKVEKKIDEVLRTRDITMSRYRKYRIPVDWLSNTGVTTKIKISYLQLAKEYMKRITKELDTMNGHPKKESNRKFLLVQGVRFAFQVHQSAGGFDEECTKAFEEIRSRVNTRSEE